MNLENENALFTLLDNIYLTADELGLDFIDFTNKFLSSAIAQNIFTHFETHYFNAYNVVIDLSKSIKRRKESFNRDFISYTAYIQGVFSLKTQVKTKDINSYISVNYLKSNFSLYHTLPDELVIEKILDDYNTRNNAMRKMRSKDNKVVFTEGLTLYIAKWIVSTLFPYPNIDYLKYEYDEFPYLENNDYFFYSYIYKDIKDLKRELNNSIYQKYCFKKECICSIVLDESKMNDIDEISSLIKSQKCFDTCYLINKRYLIKFKKGLTETFYYTITNSEIKKIKLQYDNRFLDKCV